VLLDYRNQHRDFEMIFRYGFKYPGNIKFAKLSPRIFECNRFPVQSLGFLVPTIKNSFSTVNSEGELKVIPSDAVPLR